MNRTSVALRMVVLLLLAVTPAFAGQIDPALQDVLNQSSGSVPGLVEKEGWRILRVI